MNRPSFSASRVTRIQAIAPSLGRSFGRALGRSFCRSLGLGLLMTTLVACDSGEAKPAAEAEPAKTASEPAEAAKSAEAKPDTEASAKQDDAGAGVHAMKVKTIKGEEVALADYKGKTLLIVNTASECGFTNQYADLQKLHTQYADKGLVVMGFPSNDFGGQEPGSESEIETFVHDSFGVEFPMFAKVATKGDTQAPLYKYLTEGTAEHLQGDVKWNFTKFLVDPEGQVVSRFESPVSPTDPELTGAIDALIKG